MKVNAMVMSISFFLVLAFCSFTIFQQKPNLKDKGIGPIKEVKLGPIDQKLVAKGTNLFETNCSPCHNIDDVNLAPALRGIAKVLSPEFIMNYLMNTTEMQKKDPYIQNLMQEWKNVPIMKDLKLKEKDARAILEYLRTVENPD